MLSSDAESIYWLGRYIERAENVARFVDVNLHLMLDLPGESLAQHWEALVTTSGDSAVFHSRYDAPSREHVISFLTFDRENPNSIQSCLSRARENARVIQEVITSEMWEQVNTFFLMVRSAATGGQALHDTREFFSQVRMASHLFDGITDATMSRGEAWHFLRLGRRMERADKTSRILDVKYFLLLPSASYVGTPYDDIHWGALLRSASAFEMYRKRFGRLAPERIVDFLLLDRDFPRAVHHCLLKADESLHAVSGTPIGTFRNVAEQRMGQVRAELAYAVVGEIIRSGLHEFVDALQSKLNHVGDAIHETFFAVPPAEPLTGSGEGDTSGSGNA